MRCQGDRTMGFSLMRKGLLAAGVMAATFAARRWPM
jgi:hypothetical protein